MGISAADTIGFKSSFTDCSAEVGGGIRHTTRPSHLHRMPLVRAYPPHVVGFGVCLVLDANEAVALLRIILHDLLQRGHRKLPAELRRCELCSRGLETMEAPHGRGNAPCQQHAR